MRLYLVAAAFVGLMAGSLTGCAPTLQTSVEAGRAKATAAETAPSTRCRRLNKTESALRWVARTSAALAGGAGLSTIPVDDPDARVALAISAGTLGATAAGAEALRAEVAADYLEECQ